jgi:hypothetical protein
LKKLFRKSRSKLLKSKSQYLEAWLNRVRAARAMVEAGVSELPRVSRRKRRRHELPPDQSLLTRYVRRRVQPVQNPRQTSATQQTAQSSKERKSLTLLKMFKLINFSSLFFF